MSDEESRVDDPISAFITQMIMSTLETYSRITNWNSPNLADEIQYGCQGIYWNQSDSNLKSDDPPTYLADLRDQLTEAAAKFKADLKEELKMELSMEIELLREEIANKTPVKHSLEVAPDRLHKYGGMPAFSAERPKTEIFSRDKLPMTDPMKALENNPLYKMASRSVDRAKSGKSTYTPEELIEARKGRFDDESIKDFMTAAAGYNDEDDAGLFDQAAIRGPLSYQCDLVVSGGLSNPYDVALPNAN